jgi:uncharacterized membrane protein YfcA
MVPSEPALVAAVAVVVFAAALVSSIAGFAFSALAGAALVHLLQDPMRTVAILVACSIAIHGYCAWSVRRSLEWRVLAPFLAGGALTVPLGARDATVGGLGGLLAGLAGFPGASVTVWCGLRGWSKERQRALCQPFILLMQIEALALVGAARPAALPAETFYVYLPLTLVAAWAGVGLLRRMSTAQFNLVVRLLLVVSGVALLGPVLAD